MDRLDRNKSKTAIVRCRRKEVPFRFSVSVSDIFSDVTYDTRAGEHKSIFVLLVWRCDLGFRVCVMQVRLSLI
jgi:hypothetical protein